MRKLDDGDLLCQEAKGWLKAEEWEQLDAVVEVDKESVRRRVATLNAQRDKLEQML